MSRPRRLRRRSELNSRFRYLRVQYCSLRIELCSFPYCNAIALHYVVYMWYIHTSHFSVTFISTVRSTGKWTVFVRDERHDGILRTSISSVVCTFFSRRVLFGREWRKQLKMHIMMGRTGCLTGCPFTFGAIYCTVIARHLHSTALTHTIPINNFTEIFFLQATGLPVL